MNLAPHVHAAVVGDDVVLLDLAADAYYCLPDARRAIRLARDRRSLAAAPELRSDLKAAGLSGDLPTPAVQLPGAVRADLLETRAAGLRPRDAVALVGCAWDLLWVYRGRPLPQILAAATNCRRPAAQECVDAELIDLVSRFRLGAVWLPAPAKCLARSFLLLRFLQRHGRNAHWVFGVRTWPFGAHCWLQVGDVALDEATDLVVEHTPIYAA